MDATVKSNDLKISAFVGALHLASEVDPGEIMKA